MEEHHRPSGTNILIQTLLKIKKLLYYLWKTVQLIRGRYNGKFPLPIDPKMFNEETYRRFNNFTYSLGKMVRLAEMNLDSLIGVVGLYIHITPVEEILNRNADCQKLADYDIQNKFDKLTFGNLRNILSCIIKTDTDLHHIPGLTTPKERKNFTSVYKNYIDDRDCYTHGILFFLYPAMEPILRVKTHKGDNVYVKYEKDVFTHNLQTYSYLTKILSDIREHTKEDRQPLTRVWRNGG